MTWLSDMIDKWTLKRAYKWGKGRAKTKLLVFYTLQDRYPEMPVKELYYLTILNSPRFTEKDATSIVNKAANEAEGFTLVPHLKLEKGEVQVDNLKMSVPSNMVDPFCLRTVVKQMLTHEAVQYERRNGVPHPLELYEAWNAVDDVIPADL